MTNSILDYLIAFILVLGSTVMLIAAIGLIRLQDLFLRMHAASKTVSFGTALIAIALAMHFGDPTTVFQAMLIIVFTFVTAPVASHTLGRAAYMLNVQLWEETTVDELSPHYNAEHKILQSYKFEDTINIDRNELEEDNRGKH